ncbi:MAG TPA: hypothetical protein PKK33_09775, partial [Candidatus Cloacimonadota bacterium]|nr:hypothetical protein [Candidatus Cloacimonadota bacterium]
SHWAFEEQNTLVLHQACTAIEEIGIKGCEFRQSSVVNHTLTTLKEIIEKIENIEGLPTEEPKIQKWSCVLFSFVEATSNIGKTAVRSNLTASSGNAINILNTIGRIAIDRNLSFDDDFIFKRISVIIIESMQRKNTLLTRSLIDVMQYLGSYSLSQNRIRETKRILLELKNIGKYAANQEEGQTLLKIVNSIRYIAITAIEKGITDVGSDAVRCSVKFQMIFPKFFKNQREVSFYDYPCSPSTSTTAEDFDIAMEYEYMLLDEYLHPPEYYAEDYDDGSMVISL